MNTIKNTVLTFIFCKMTDVKKGGAYSHVLKYTSIFGGVQILSVLMALVKNKLVAVILGPVGMGHVTIFNTSINFISQVTNLGIPFSSVRNISEAFDSGDMRKLAESISMIRAWSLLTALLGVLVCIIAGPLLDSLTFDWGNHTLHFIILSPAVGLVAISGGETAVLKGTRRLKQLAKVQVVSIFFIVILSIPIYLALGNTGVVPVIVLGAAITFLVTIFYSYRFYPVRVFKPQEENASATLSLSGMHSSFKGGAAMVRLGIVYTLAAIVGSGVEMLIRSYLNIHGDIGIAGCYNAGYMLTITYASMVFSAIDTDYFPRLSAVNKDRVAVNDTVNKQVEVAMLIISPLLAIFIVLMPVVLPILYSGAFSVVAGMAQVAVFSMYIKALSLPMAYVNLAKGDSRSYFIIEVSYYVALAVFIVLGFSRFGLFGTGVALVIAHFLELLLAYLFIHFRHGYIVSRGVVRYSLVQVALGLLVYGSTYIDDVVFRYVVGVLIFLISAVYSVVVLRSKVLR